MGTSGHLIIHSCPPHQARHFLAAIEECTLYGGADVVAETLTFGAHYYSSNGDRPGIAADIADALDAAPAAAWTVWQDPYEENLGYLFRYVPGLGEHRGDCDSKGNLLVTAAAVRTALAGPAAVADLLGTAWTDAIAALPTGGTVTEPAKYGVEWDRRSGEVRVEGAADGGQDVVLTMRQTGDIDTAVADQFLARHGFIRADDDWFTVISSGRVKTTDVYRAEVSAAPTGDTLTPPSTTAEEIDDADGHPCVVSEGVMAFLYMHEDGAMRVALHVDDVDTEARPEWAVGVPLKVDVGGTIVYEIDANGREG